MKRRKGRRILPVSLLFLSPLLLHAQEEEYATPDAVESFTQGEGGGRGSQYMPGNVLGLPDTVGRVDVATIDPEQILSLGLDGEIILRFDRVRITDGPGTDFTIFENAFEYRLGGKDKIYAEPAEVAVSRDGVEYVPFPYDPATLEGCAGVTPTNGDRPPYDPALSGGDGFDLAQIGMDSVRFIRIRDVTRIVKENPEHAFYDVTLNGFDLDAAVALHTQQIATSGLPDLAAAPDVILNLPSAIDGSASFIPLDLSLPRPAFVRARLFDVEGKEAGRAEASISGGGERIAIPADNLPAGTYFLSVEAEGIGTATRTVRILR